MQIQKVRDQISKHSADVVAKATGIHANTIYRFRRGENIGLQKFNDLVAFLEAQAPDQATGETPTPSE